MEHMTKATPTGSTGSMRSGGLVKLGDAVAMVRKFEKRGGTCIREGCAADAPFVIWGETRIALACRVHAAEDAANEKREKLAVLAAKLLPQAGITERIGGWSFETYRRDCGDADGLAPLAIAEKWVADYVRSIPADRELEGLRGYAPSMFFHGQIGCGKTGLAWAMVRELCEQGVKSRLVNYRALLDAMKDCFARKLPITHALGVNTLPVLVLDDLGSETPTKWAREQLLGIVDYRYEARLATVYVSNLRPSKLATFLGHDDPVIGERIVSRMTDGAIQVEFLGGDRRRKLAA